MFGFCLLVSSGSEAEEDEEELEEQEECDRDVELEELPDDEEDTQFTKSQVATIGCFPLYVACSEPAQYRLERLFAKV